MEFGSVEDVKKIDLANVDSYKLFCFMQENKPFYHAFMRLLDAKADAHQAVSIELDDKSEELYANEEKAKSDAVKQMSRAQDQLKLAISLFAGAIPDLSFYAPMLWYTDDNPTDWCTADVVKEMEEAQTKIKEAWVAIEKAQQALAVLA